MRIVGPVRSDLYDVDTAPSQAADGRTVITFRGVDLVDGTPVPDVKPWFADCDLPLQP